MMVASPLKLGILGIRGRMGQAILQEAKGFSDLTVIAGTTRTLSPSLPDILLSQEAAFVFEFCDLVIDFSHHELFTSHLKEALSARKPFLVGTTGLAEKDHALFPEAGTQIPLLYTPNTSLGISLLVQHVRDAARLLDHSYDVEIFESHHRHKKDAPSGTA
ncbi:MAG: 4-hydroxy-tetrahydrodipicolinate reductase, partial [Holosporales bacterium]